MIIRVKEEQILAMRILQGKVSGAGRSADIVIEFIDLDRVIAFCYLPHTLEISRLRVVNDDDSLYRLYSDRLTAHRFKCAFE